MFLAFGSFFSNFFSSLSSTSNSFIFFWNETKSFRKKWITYKISIEFISTVFINLIACNIKKSFLRSSPFLNKWLLLNNTLCFCRFWSLSWTNRLNWVGFDLHWSKVLASSSKISLKQKLKLKNNLESISSFLSLRS